jgi:Asp-tRNA(Asn)/Glu-tRNA(Gln) amidotransferase A subunit family amidase
MKRFLLPAPLVGTLLLAAAPLRAQAPSDLFLAELRTGEDGRVTAGPAMNLTRRQGYDNQPSFTPDGRSILYTAIDATGQADTWRYELAGGRAVRVTATPESEYSPAVMPGGERFAVVRVEADSTQRLWSFRHDGSDPRLVFERVRPVGYFAFGDANVVVMFILGSPPTLHVGDVRTGESREVARDIGRSIRRIPGRNAISFTQRTAPDELWIMELELADLSVRRITAARPGADDHAWLPDGSLLQAARSTVSVWQPADEVHGLASGAAGATPDPTGRWVAVRDFADDGITDITRMDVSPDGNRLVFVGNQVATPEHVEAATELLALPFTAEERAQMLRGLVANRAAWEELRQVDIDYAVAPAVQFDAVLPGMTLPSERRPVRPSAARGVTRPANLDELAFWPLTDLGELVRTRQVTAEELTRLSLDRLRRWGDTLEAVVSLTEARALEQARRLDRELAEGRYRGPLHGIPWVAKDLLAVRGYRTTWGAAPFEQQVIDLDATVVERLDSAGAVLVAKVTLGALASGDNWFGGRTRNPWNLEQGSSGSSAGSAAATAAGLVPFAIGTETLGSIVSPSTRTGTTGLRPTFGRVSRHGAMALSWSMDKIGPICRAVEDCALVFDAIRGPDNHDPTIRDVPFNWDAQKPLSQIRIGYYRSAFEAERDEREFDDAALDALRALGVELVPVELPAGAYPLGALRSAILSAEAGAAFDELTRSGRVNLMERSSWPNSFRQARFIPAVEYLQANRVRTMLMHATHEALRDVDVFITPSYGGEVLLLTNLTGHPAVVLPSGFRADGTPTSISFVGALFGEADLLRVAKAWQDATGHHLRRPALFSVVR